MGKKVSAKPDFAIIFFGRVSREKLREARGWRKSGG